MSVRDVLTCELCSFEGRRLGPHLKHKHGMTVQEYRTAYPHVEYVNLSSRDSMRRLHKSDQGEHLVSSLQRGLRARWERSDAHKDQSDRAKAWWQDPENRKHGSKKNAEKAQAYWEEHGDEAAPKILTAQHGFRLYYRTRSGSDVTLRSRWELFTAYLLDVCEMPYEYEPRMLVWQGINGRTRRYFPDFLVFQAVWIEVKNRVTAPVVAKFATAQTELPFVLLGRQSLGCLGIPSDWTLKKLLTDRSTHMFDTLIRSQSLGETPRSVQRLLRTALEEAMRQHERGAHKAFSLCDEIVHASGKLGGLRIKSLKGEVDNA